MKKLILSVFIAAFAISSAQAGDITSERIKYSSADIYKNGRRTTKDLYLYTHKPSNENCIKKPFVLLVHGGGFINGNGTGSTNDQAKKLAENGFITASLNYRVVGDNPIPSEKFKRLAGDGLAKAEDFNIRLMDMERGVNINDINWVISKYREGNDRVKRITKRKRQAVAMAAAMEDLSKALNVIHRHADHHCIDKDRISVVGKSAGAITAVNLIYAANHYRITIPTIHSVVNLYGGLMHLDLLRSNSSPILSIHGTNDRIIPHQASVLLSRAARRKGMYQSTKLLNGASHGNSDFWRAKHGGKTANVHILEFLRKSSF
ncbi:MAG: alpha/beta hydrolase [Bdellovibrionales bacterium]